MSTIDTRYLSDLQDNEPDVRTNVLKGMIQFQAVVPQALYIGDLMPIAMHLVEDPYLSARKLLAELCIDIAAKVKTVRLCLDWSCVVLCCVVLCCFVLCDVYRSHLTSYIAQNCVSFAFTSF